MKQILIEAQKNERELIGGKIFDESIDKGFQKQFKRNNQKNLSEVNPNEISLLSHNYIEFDQENIETTLRK